MHETALHYYLLNVKCFKTLLLPDIICMHKIQVFCWITLCCYWILLKKSCILRIVDIQQWKCCLTIIIVLLTLRCIIVCCTYLKNEENFLSLHCWICITMSCAQNMEGDYLYLACFVKRFDKINGVIVSSRWIIVYIGS